MATRFQQLGAFVNHVEKLTDERLKLFAQSGGRWIVPLLAQLGYPDDHDPACVYNLKHIGDLLARCAKPGIGLAVGGWFNGWAGGTLGTTATQDAQHVADIIHSHPFTGPCVLDLEVAYKMQPQEMPKLVSACRAKMPTRGLLVSTNEPNDSMIYNGGASGDAASFWHLGVRLAPQWYPWMGKWGSPTQTMEWITAHGMEDNWHDPHGPNGRAVPRTWVKGTLEATGLEGSSLAPQITDFRVAKAKYGLDYGLSLYTLESAPDSDLGLLAAERGKLFLV